MITNPKILSLLKLLDNKKINTSEIARIARRPRTTIEYELNKLSKIHLVSKSKIKNQTYWEKISTTTHSENGITILGNLNIVKEIIKSINRKKIEVLIIESDKTVQIFEKKKISHLFQDINTKLSEKSALVYILFHKNTIPRMIQMFRDKSLNAKSIKLLANRAMSAHVLPEHFLNLNVHIAVIGDIVFITDFKKEISIKIDQENLAEFFKQFYEFISPFLEKVNVKVLLENIVNNKK